jgi:hypothetical protein
MKRVAVLVFVCSASISHAQQVHDRSALETILDDAVLLEDFESLSLHSGSSFDVPNPLNSLTVDKSPWNWDVLPGISYESPIGLSLYGGFLNGTEDVYLRSDDALNVSFDEPQVAFGFDLIGAQQGQSYTMNVYGRDDQLLDMFLIPSSQTTVFFGYQAPLEGIMRVHVVHSSFDRIAINDVAYGFGFQPCPADMNGEGRHDFFDVSAFLGYYSKEDDRADYTDDGQFDFFDVSAFLNAYTVSCP